MKEILEEMQQEVAARIAAGFDSEEDIVVEVTEILEEDHDRDDLQPQVELMVTEEMEKHRVLQSSWVEMTDCDRLEMAFHELNKSGIVARENFSCCGNCGCAEIGDEDNAETADGYVFYHMQDTERAVEGGGLFFNYGAFSEDHNRYEQLSAEIGHRVVAALKANGLQPDWDGDLQKRIELPLKWQRRRI